MVGLGKCKLVKGLTIKRAVNLPLPQFIGPLLEEVVAGFVSTMTVTGSVDCNIPATALDTVSSGGNLNTLPAEKRLSACRNPNPNL